MLKGLKKSHYRVILADPPWHFKTFTAEVGNRDPRNHYKTMTLERIKALPIAQYAADDCHLFLWATGPMLPQALEVISAWGFNYSALGFSWVKLKRSHDGRRFIVQSSVHVGLGYTTRHNSEFCLLARRGNPKRRASDVRELIMAPIRQHSRKPDETFERIERYAEGPYLELFARQRRKGWTVRGDQSDLFS